MTDTSTHTYEKLGVYQEPRMRRDVNWLQVVFIAAGSPALVMFNLGGLAAITGTISPLIWAISVILGFLELFVYAEIADFTLTNRVGLRCTVPPPGCATAKS